MLPGGAHASIARKIITQADRSKPDRHLDHHPERGPFCTIPGTSITPCHSVLNAEKKKKMLTVFVDDRHMSCSSPGVIARILALGN
jgi:hypothetical protein